MLNASQTPLLHTLAVVFFNMCSGRPHAPTTCRACNPSSSRLKDLSFVRAAVCCVGAIMDSASKGGAEIMIWRSVMEECTWRENFPVVHMINKSEAKETVNIPIPPVADLMRLNISPEDTRFSKREERSCWLHGWNTHGWWNNSPDFIDTTSLRPFAVTNNSTSDNPKVKCVRRVPFGRRGFLRAT